VSDSSRPTLGDLTREIRRGIASLAEAAEPAVRERARAMSTHLCDLVERLERASFNSGIAVGFFAKAHSLNTAVDDVPAVDSFAGLAEGIYAASLARVNAATEVGN
jgi:hypothetical protein